VAAMRAVVVVDMKAVVVDIDRFGGS